MKLSNLYVGEDGLLKDSGNTKVFWIALTRVIKRDLVVIGVSKHWQLDNPIFVGCN